MASQHVLLRSPPPQPNYQVILATRVVFKIGNANYQKATKQHIVLAFFFLRSQTEGIFIWNFQL